MVRCQWWLGGTNDEPRWLVIIVDQQERTDDEPRWLVVIEVVVRWWLGGTNDEPRWLVVVVVGCVLVVVRME